MADCREIAISEEYADFIVNYSGDDTEALKAFNVPCFQRISSNYGIIYRPLAETRDLSIRNYSYGSIPALYGLMERDIEVRYNELENALEESGILRLQRQPVLQLRGQNTIMGYVDTGIDIRDREFRFSNGDTRILRLWDMTDNTGTPPVGISYGSEYKEEDINRILRADEELNGVNGNVNVEENDYKMVEKTVGKDELNHGNVLAKIGAGNSGAAPESYLVVVKLKRAKQYLRDYYLIKEDSVAFQENDIMLAINYIKSISNVVYMPVSICMALGTNSRSHDGKSALSYVLDRFVSSVGASAVITTGDEGNKQLHASGTVESVETARNTSDSGGDFVSEVQFRVDERQTGLIINIWADNPQIFSVGIISPTGEVIQRVPARVGKSDVYELIFDNTTVLIEYDIVEGDTGDELIIVRLERPTAGIWTLRIYGEDLYSGDYNIYMPISQFIYENTYFLEPSPDITITDPGLSKLPITTSTYNPTSDSLYISNGRGFSRDGDIKPDIASPISCALTAGAVSQFLTWGIINGNDERLRNSDIKSYLIRGANRRDDITYPNRGWGYGTLDIYNAFERLRE